jgi:cobalt-zinc-cadmium efflux system outer membrane protein
MPRLLLVAVLLTLSTLLPADPSAAAQDSPGAPPPPPSATPAGGLRAFTFEEALRRAEEASPLSRVIGLGIDRARADARAAGLWPNPGLSLLREESAGVVERFDNLSLDLPVWGRLGLEKDAGRRGLAAEEASARQGRFELRARVGEAFIDLLLAQKRTAALEAGGTRLFELVEALRAREREGESSGYDRMRAERELADLEVDLLGTRGGQAGARAALAALLALPSEGLAVAGALDAAETLPGLEALRALARSRGDVAAFDAQAEQADLLARAARRRGIPEPSITAGRKTTMVRGAEDTGPVLGVALSIPLFNRGQGERGVARAEADLLRARSDALAREVEAQVEAAHAEAAARRAAEQRYAAAGDPDDLMTIARAAYDGGAMRILELLDAYRTALAARLRKLDLHAAARRAEVTLGRAAGADVTGAAGAGERGAVTVGPEAPDAEVDR